MNPSLNSSYSVGLPDYETPTYPNENAFCPKHVWNHGMSNNGEFIFYPFNTVDGSENHQNENDTDSSGDEDFHIDKLIELD